MDDHPDDRAPVAIVTGASSGIGLVAARDLAARGFEVVTVSRAEGSGAERAREIEASTGRRVHFVPADLARPVEAVRAADAVRALVPRIDVLINNAGAYVAQRERTQEGFERTFALNHLGPFALTAALEREVLANRARVITVSSNAAHGARLQLDDPNSERGYLGWRAYAWSKLCNQLFALELARRTAGTGVRVASMHPGFVATQFGHGDGVTSRIVRALQGWFGRTPEQGADTLVWLATEATLPGADGAFYVDRRVRPVARPARDPAAQRALWRISVQALCDAGVDLPAFASGALGGE